MSCVDVDFSEPPDLLVPLERLLSQIPSGQVTTFGTLARALGDVRAAAWVATILKQPSFRSKSPWYRVVRANGELAGSTPAQQLEQAELLRLEGISCDQGCVCWQQTCYAPSLPDPPLALLQAEQQAVQLKVRIEPAEAAIQTVAGLDIAFPKTGIARAAYVELDQRTGQILWQQTIEHPCRFPYIPGYLSYREIPAYLQLIQQITQERPLADLLMIDGSGLLHPRQSGIACHLGVLIDRPTLGISKKLLAGKLANPVSPTATPILLQGELLAGYQLAHPAHAHPVYVSPGHRCEPEQARLLVEACWQLHTLPEPTYLADRLSRLRPLA